MPLRLRITGEPGGAAPPGPPPLTDTLLATEAGEIIVTDADEGIVAEPTNVQ